MDKKSLAVLCLLMVMGCGVTGRVGNNSKDTATENKYIPKRTGIDTVIVKGKVFSAKTMKARIFLYGNDGYLLQAIHTYPDRVVFTQPDDTVVYNLETRKIVKNLSLERRTANVKCCCDYCCGRGR